MTAVEFLVKEFSDMLGPLDIKPMQELLLVDAIKRAKEMEKEQIIKATLHGFRQDSDGDDWEGDNYNAEQYYNETFKQ
jgi:hypothetical protein